MSKAATPAPAAGQTPADTLLERLRETLQHAVTSLTPEVVTDALRAASPLESAALVLRQAAAPEIGRITPWIDALLRGAEYKQQIAAAAGGLLSSGQVAELLGITTSAIQQRRNRNKLLAVPTLQSDWGYPAHQFSSHGVPEGVGKVVGADPEIDPWIRLSILTQPAGTPPEPERTLLERLDEPETTSRAIRLVASYGAQGPV